MYDWLRPNKAAVAELEIAFAGKSEQALKESTGLKD